MTQRKAFNFYASYWEQIKLLNDKQKLEIFSAICSVQFLEENINDIEFKDKLCTLVWTGIKHSVSSSLSGFINKNKSIGNQVIEPLSKGGVVPPMAQEKGEVQEQVQVKGEEKDLPTPYEFLSYALEKKPDVNKEAVSLKYQAWVENGWKDGNNKAIKNWKSKILNTLPYLKDEKTGANNNRGFKCDTTQAAIESVRNGFVPFTPET